MRLGSLSLVLLLGCSSSNGGIGDHCDEGGECASALQCVAHTCTPRCQRAPDCGDGYTCEPNGACKLATGQQGDACTAEDACAPGLACVINGSEVDATGHLAASCVAALAGHPAGAACDGDTDCRNGTCALGRCVDLCDVTRDCSSGLACMEIPRVDPVHPEADGKRLRGCLPAHGNLAWTIPVAAPAQSLLLPIPDGATAVAVVMSVDDGNQLVGVTRATAPNSALLLASCAPGDLACDPLATLFANPIRHQPAFGQSVFAIPSSPTTELAPGLYHLDVASLRQVQPTGSVMPGSAIPRVTAVVKLDSNVLLDLHFHFLDLTDHPCKDALGGPRFGAADARALPAFQTEFLGELRGIFAHGGVALGTLTYDDIDDHPDLDGLDASDLPSLLALGTYAGGVNVFFVRNLSPAGLQALGPNPGPAGLGGTRQSGIVLGIDTLCYRSWSQLARLTAHELGRYMGLYHNVETLTDRAGATLRDPIDDSDDTSANLMFYSELGGTDLSAGQRDVLTRSPVLR